jgi:hypothetical protein
MIAIPRIVVRTPPRRNAVRALQNRISKTMTASRANIVAVRFTVIGPGTGAEAAAADRLATRS